MVVIVDLPTCRLKFQAHQVLWGVQETIQMVSDSVTDKDETT
jgi:hypothetical protein